MAESVFKRNKVLYGLKLETCSQNNFLKQLNCNAVTFYTVMTAQAQPGHIELLKYTFAFTLDKNN